jgi:hypothetical protein
VVVLLLLLLPVYIGLFRVLYPGGHLRLDLDWIRDELGRTGDNDYL